jgi:O-antigen/teichoic acid export membrane protein
MVGDARWMLLGSVAYAVGQWAQLALLARSGGATAVGAYAFALSLTAPLMMLASLQVRTLQASDARGDYGFLEYRKVRLVTNAVAVLAIVAISVATGAWALWPVLLPVCAMRAADEVTDIYYGEWQRQGRMSAIALGLALNATASVAFMAVALALGGGVPAGATGSALGSGAALALMHFRTLWDPCMRRLSGLGTRRPAGWKRVRKLIVEAAPLGVILLFNSLQHNVPYYFVRLHGGETATGVFAAANQLTSVGMLLVAALTSAALPRFAALSLAGDLREFRVLSRKLVLFGGLLGVAGVGLSWVAGAKILAFLYRPEFAAGSTVLVVLSIAAGTKMLGSILGFALTSARVIAFQPSLLAFTLAVVVVGCALLVPGRGTIGAAWAMVIAGALQVLVSQVVVSRFRADIRVSRESVAAP